MPTLRAEGLALLCLTAVTFAPTPCHAADSAAPGSFPAVEIMHPLDGWELTDVGVSFRWRRQCEPGKWTTWKYQLQVADSADFAKPFIDRTLPAPGDPAHPSDYMYWRQMSYQPPEVLAPGKWYWRVRVADGAGGPWSKAASFAVNDNHDTTEPARPLSADNPLFVFDMYNLEALADVKWDAYWDTIPEDLKPYVAFQVNRFGVGGPSAPDQSYLDVMKRLADLKIPAMIGTGGPDKPVANYADLAEVEYLFQHFPNVEGIVTGETFWASGDRATEEGNYYVRLLQLCGKYGRLFVQGDGNSGDFAWDRFFAHKRGGTSFSPPSDRVGPATLHRYSAYFVPCAKTNLRDAFFEAQSAVLGAWVTGLVGNFGYWHEAWYWQECHFGDPFAAPGATGDLRKMPPILWDQAFLTGLASGATVLKFGGESSVVEWGTYDAAKDSFDRSGPNYTALWDMAGHKTQVLDRYVVPFLRGIVAHKMIPTRQEVWAAVPCVIDPGSPNSEKGDAADYGRFAPLYKATYGLTDRTDLLPNSARCYFLPIVPNPARALPGLQVMSIADLATEADVHKALDEKCKPRYTGDAWVVMMGPRLYITNSEENRDVAQSFSLPLPGPIESLSGKALPHSYMMGRLSNDGGTLWLQANVNVKGPYTDDRSTDLMLHCASAPEVKVDPADALSEKTWDKVKRDLHVRLSHKAGAVDLSVHVGLVQLSP